MQALTIHTIDAEPRVLDTDLAVRLGMKNVRKIRTDLIEANRHELETYGRLWSERLQTGGRPANVFYLNEGQALLVCMFSRTKAAMEVRREVIAVFLAWRHGTLSPEPQGRIPQTYAEALRLAADEHELRLQAEAREKVAQAEAEAMQAEAFGPADAPDEWPSGPWRTWRNDWRRPKSRIMPRRPTRLQLRPDRP